MATALKELIHTALFLPVYLAAVMVNLFIIAVNTLDRKFHTPMYLFLKNLPIFDLAYISVALIHTELFFLFYLAVIMGNLLIIAVTTLDWHFHTPMYFFLKNLSILDLGCITVTVPKSIFNSLTNVNYIILLGWDYEFFCHSAQLLAYSIDYGPEDMSLAISICLAFFCFGLIVSSYIRIFSAMLRMSSAEGSSKAFSTCLPHLFVVTLFLTSGFSA
ncbi:olfactory receptor 14A16-like [Tachyglossus aculeatus]|uniref:olfactory receptor 14A16-like n=1 Tax=Tachyglossus aculeatus TaxID=9261 RepID=UPI0018F4FDFC|nr:olfactory receptor 14A16-like [Tachyglossus aculeatus]